MNDKPKYPPEHEAPGEITADELARAHGVLAEPVNEEETASTRRLRLGVDGGGDVGVNPAQFDKYLAEAGLEERGGRIVPKHKRVSIRQKTPGDHASMEITVDGVEQSDVVRYEFVHAIGTRGEGMPILTLYRLAIGVNEIEGEYEIVERVANEARRNVHRAAINAFAITEEPEVNGDSLAAIIRDAKRYRAIRCLVNQEAEAVKFETAQVSEIRPWDGAQLDVIADELRLGHINSGQIPLDPGNDDSPALRQWFEENPARDQFGDASKAT
jgi:hypothetical protein